MQADLAESFHHVSELEARVEGLELENGALHAEVEGHVEQLEELQALREEAAGWEAQLAESEDTLAQVGSVRPLCIMLWAGSSVEVAADIPVWLLELNLGLRSPCGALYVACMWGSLRVLYQKGYSTD